MDGSGFAFSPVNGGSFFGHLGREEKVAYDPRAPLDEVSDAGASVFSKYHDPSSIQPDLISMIGDWVRLNKAQQMAEAHAGLRPMSKSLAMHSEKDPGGKARTEPVINRLAAIGGYITKPGLPFLALRDLSKRVEVEQAILRTRGRQVQAFSAQSSKDDVVGWNLCAASPNAELGQDHTDFLVWLSRWLENGGTEFGARERRKAGQVPFRPFLGRLTKHSYSFDHAVVEMTPLPGGGIGQFWCRDSATFYLANEFDRPDVDDIFMVQETMRGMGGVQNFSYDEVSLFQRNADADIEMCGYGVSELESGIDTISNYLMAIAHNREGLDNNAIPRGILQLSGLYSPEQKAAFHAAWAAKVRGSANAFGMPVLFSHGQQGNATYLQTSQPFSEMDFKGWISLQVAILCAIHGMDPAEIGMETYASSGVHGLSGDDTAERLAASRDKGFDPFMADLDSFITDELISPWAPWARFKFMGIKPGDEVQRAKDKARLQTIDELRESLNMDPYPIAWVGALPADPTIMAQELARQQIVLTVDEARKVFGGLPAYPTAAVGAAPINPSLQAVFNAAMQGGQDQGGSGGEDPFSNAENEDGAGEDGAEGEDGQEDADAEGADGSESGDAPPPGLAEDVASRLKGDEVPS